MNLIIYVNKHYEEEQALVDLDNKSILLKGDYYHDKIGNLIEGYLSALRDFDIYNKDVTHEEIDCNHQMYNTLEFYNEEDDE